MNRVLLLIMLCAACTPKGKNRELAESLPEPDSTASRWLELPTLADEKKHKIRILVLPPYDKIAGEGISPNTRGIMETLLATQDGFEVTPFPFRELMGTNHQMVYDKKYCPPILEKVPCDIIIMTYLHTSTELTAVPKQWVYATKVFNPKTGKEVHSIKGKGMAAEEVQDDIDLKKDQLVESILATF